ncbi:MAG: transglutaminase family protein [Planctomycetota bacterium]
MLYRITHTTKYAYAEPVAVCHNLVRLSPRATVGQRVRSHRLIVMPEPADLVQRQDALGNQVGYFSIEQAHHGLSLSATSEVEVTGQPEAPAGPPWETIRDALPKAPGASAVAPYRFAFDSPLVPREAELAAYAAASFTPGRPIIDALRDLTARIHDEFDYDPRATTVTTPVREAFEGRAGVCQDFAHVAIACLRSLGLAARYVSGYLRTLPPPGKPRLVGADASHAWLSLYCGPSDTGQPLWVDADPTNNKLTGVDYVTVALGRDYADVCPIQGVYVGGGNHTMDVSVDVAPVE